jgi:HemY protein
MIRVIVFLVLVALIAFGAVWFIERPGDVAITWQGWRIETSVMVAVVAIAIVVVVALVLWSLLRTFLRIPDLIAMYLSHRRGVRGYRAISRGLVAVGAGDARTARKAADEAERIAPGEPLALLLNAQCAQLTGDRASAELAFRAMAERDDTKLLGLRGLYVEAQRRGDAVAAQAFAEEAAKAAPALAWAGQAVLDLRCAAGDWDGALAALDRNSRNGLADKEQHRRQRAVLLTARAVEAEENDPERARALALDAVKLEPAFAPAAELAGRLLGAANEIRRASRLIEKAWQADPHPDLADAYAHLRAGDSARERLARVETLARLTPGQPEAALAVARAALDAHEFAVAREALTPLLQQPTQRVAELMAQIEQSEHGDEGRAREWMARALRAARDPAWTADGVVTDRWMPVSPVSGRLDAFQWRVPVSRVGGHEAPVIEAENSARAAAPPAIIASESGPLPADERNATDEVPPPSEPSVPASVPSLAPPRPPAPPIPPRVEAVIPLIHAPDDPGPEPAPDREPAPEPTAAARGLRLFK